MRSFIRKRACVALLVAALLPSGLAWAQSGEPEQSERSAENAPGNAAPEQKSQEDQAEQFKHSPSVRFLGKITGLGTEGGYWLAAGLNFLIVSALSGGYRGKICRLRFATALRQSRSNWKKPARPAKMQTGDYQTSNHAWRGWAMKSAICARSQKRKQLRKNSG